jgi:PAS domain S-box-containing protein
MPAPTRIGVVMAALGGYYWGGILTGIQRVIQQRGCEMLVFQGTPGVVAASAYALEQVDGWIVVHYTHDLQALAARGQPIVTVANRAPDVACPAVLADNRGGVAEVVNHLIAHGHHRIAFVGWLENLSIQQRYEGYLEALATHGIPIDPRLVISVGNNQAIYGQDGAQRLIAMGMPCTAIVAGTDLNAIGALETVQAAGYRVPTDICIVGFDDINLTQFVSPPLTTVRTQFDTLGATAAELLLEQIAGHSVQPDAQLIPVTLIRRRSCGCESTADMLASAAFAASSAEDWSSTLTTELVRLALFPSAPDASTSAYRVWPGAAVLVGGLVAALEGGQAPSDDDLERAWQQGILLTVDLDTLSAMIKLLERAGAQRLGAVPQDAAASSRLEVFVDRARLEMLRARVAIETLQNRNLERLMQNSYEISMSLLGDDPGYIQQLHWLQETHIRWGCLALHVDGGSNKSGALVVVGAYHRTGGAMPPLGSHYPATAFPPTEFLSAAAQEEVSDIVMLLPIKTDTHDWGVLALCAPVEKQLTSDRPNIGMWAALLGAALERKSLLAELAEQQDMLRLAYEQRLITENIRDLIGMLDQEGRYLYASPSYRHVLGYSPTTLIGAVMFDFIHPDDLPSARELWAQAMASQTIQATLRTRHADGSWRWLEIAGTVIARQGAPSVVMVSRDVTERRRLQAELLQSQKMETVGRLAGGVAHDFNNLLTVITGYADVALASVAPDDVVREDLDAILKAAQRAANLTRQLLTFARKQVIEARVINLKDLVLELNNLLRRLIGEDIELVVRLAPDLWPVRADPSQIEQVLVNLAVNARDAMPHGGILTIETANAELKRAETQHVDVVAGPYVLLAVSDTGVGIAPGVQEHIFEPFFTTKSPGQGTGLGLATCYGIIAQHGGYIWPYSEAGQGTTFKIYLPRAQSVADLDQPDRGAEQPPRGSEVILLAEDEESVRALTARMLRKLGYTVLEAVDGEDALQIAQAYGGPIDLLLTDVVMPRMGGPRLREQLVDIYPSVRVLYMSGYTDNALINQGRLEEGVDLLPKPFAPLALARKVRDALDG